MAKRKILTDFTRYTDAQLDDKAEEIIDALSNPPGSTNFPTPQPAISVVQDDLDDYRAARAAAANKDTVKVELKNIARTKLENTLADLGEYLDLASGDDVEKKLSTGFELSKIRTPKGELPKVQGLKLAPTSEGVLKARWNRVDGANSYEIHLQQEGNATVKQLVSPKASIVIEGLESGKKYGLKVAAVGAHPSRIFSDEVKSFVI